MVYNLLSITEETGPCIHFYCSGCSVWKCSRVCLCIIYSNAAQTSPFTSVSGGDWGGGGGKRNKGKFVLRLHRHRQFTTLFTVLCIHGLFLPCVGGNLIWVKVKQCGSVSSASNTYSHKHTHIYTHKRTKHLGSRVKILRGIMVDGRIYVREKILEGLK